MAEQNIVQGPGAWASIGRLLDLLSALRHAPYLTRHRLAAIDARARAVAVAFALATLVWIGFDAATLSADHWRTLAACRVFVALVLFRVAIKPNAEPSRARALAMLGIVLAMPLLIYGLSQFFLAGTPVQGLAAVNGNLYRALPLMVLASLSAFPLLTSEALLFIVVIASAVVQIQRVFVGVDSAELFSTIWMFMPVLGIYLIACAIQLHYMMNLAGRASHDPLTGALTRRSGVEVLDLHFRLACAQDAPLSILLVGADNFKSIAGRSGTSAGDQALHEVAAKLHLLLRLADVVIRWDDNSFVVILANTPIRGARLVIERFIGDWLNTHPEDAPIASGIGLAERQSDGAQDWWQMIGFAGKRMRTVMSSDNAGK